MAKKQCPGCGQFASLRHRCPALRTPTASAVPARSSGPAGAPPRTVEAHLMTAGDPALTRVVVEHYRLAPEQVTAQHVYRFVREEIAALHAGMAPADGMRARSKRARVRADVESRWGRIAWEA